MKKLLQSTTFATVMTLCVNMVAGVAMARVLGPEGRGTLGAIITWPAIFAILFIFGLQDWVSLKVSKSKSSKEAKDQENQAFAWACLLGIAGAFVCSASYFFLISEQQWEYGLLFFIYTLHTPLAVLYAVASNVTTAHNDTRSFNIGRILNGSSHLILTLFVLAFAEDKFLFLVIEHLIALSIPVIYFYSKYPPSWPKSLSVSKLKESLALHPSFVLATLSLALDKAVAVYFLTNTAIGFYHVAHTLALNVAMTFGISFQYLILPQSTQIEDHNERARYIVSNIQFALILIMFSCLLIVPVAPWLLSTIYGKSFLGAAPVIQFLLPGYAFIFTKSIASRAIKALGLVSLSNQMEIVFLIGLGLSVGYFLNSSGLTPINLAQSCLISAGTSYIYFLFCFYKMTDVTLKDLFQLKAPSQYFILKIKDLLNG